MYAYLLPLLLCLSLVSHRFLRRISDTIIDKAFASTASTTSSTPSEQTASSSGDSTIDKNSYIRQSRHLDQPQSRRIRVTFQPDGEGASEIYEITLPELYPAVTSTTIPLAGESLAAPPPPPAPPAPPAPAAATSPPDPSVLLRSEQEHLRNPIHRHIFQADDEINEVQQHNQDALPKSPFPWTVPSVDPPRPTAGRRLPRQSPAVSPRVETARPIMPTTPRRTAQRAPAGGDNVQLPPQPAYPTKPQSDYEHIRQNRPSSPAGEFSNRLRDGMGGIGMGPTGNIPLGTTGYVPPSAMPIPQATVMPTMMPGYLPSHIPGPLPTQSTMPPVPHLQPLPTQPMGNPGWLFPGAYPNPYIPPPQHTLGPGSGTYLMSTPPQPIPPGQPQVSPPVPASVTSATVPSQQTHQGQSQCPYCEHEHHHHHHHYRSRSPSRSRSRSSDRVVVVSGAPGGGGGGGGGVGGGGYMGGFGGIWDPLTMYKEQELEKKTLADAHKSEKKKLEDEVKDLKNKADEKNKFISIRNEELKKIWELPLSKVKTWHSLQQKMIEAFPSSAAPLLSEGYYEVRRLEDNVHILPTLWPEVMKESKEYEIILIPPPVPAAPPAPAKKSKGLANLKNGSFQKWYAEVDKKGRERKIIG
ncbi:uncharacterized protein V1513DRAFT_380297 [Lipomyces chichibuensis]|uniref:uncharacterized protein n=1 Tax=Lipomyces chichibuensis TaxID=1546026 RepID=UPI0033441FC8